jgi:hypothetical protein
MLSDFVAFCDRNGNVASVLGFIVSLIGFGLTLWTIYRVKKDTQATRQAAKEAVDRIGVQFLGGSIDVILRMVRDAKTACRSANWPRAIDHCEDSIVWMAQLGEDIRLQPDERTALAEAIDTVRVVIGFLEGIRPGVSRPQGLSATREQLNQVIMTLSGIHGRLRRTASELP